MYTSECVDLVIVVVLIIIVVVAVNFAVITTVEVTFVFISEFILLTFSSLPSA